MPFEIGDRVRIHNLDNVEYYNEEYDEYEEDEDQPYVEDEMVELMDDDTILTITGFNSWNNNIIANGYEWHRDWLIMFEKKPRIELTGANAVSKYKVVIAKVLEMNSRRKGKGYAF